MRNVLFMLLAYVTMSSTAYGALTPQKYCESLAATSCELLNIDIVAGTVDTNLSIAPIANIKYCRNQVFKTITYELVTDGPTSRQVPVASTNANKRSLRVYENDVNANYYVAVNMDNTLCSATILMNSLTGNLLP